jgi:hypothetical protein
MRASGIQCKSRYDPPKRREYLDKRKRKDIEISSISFMSLAPRSKNK